MATTIAPAGSVRLVRFAAAVFLSAAAPLSAADLTRPAEEAEADPYGIVPSLAKVSNVADRGEGAAAAANAVRTLAAAEPDQIGLMLGWFSAASPVGRNLLAGAVQAVADDADAEILAAAANDTLRRGNGVRRTGPDGFTMIGPLHPEAAALAFRLLEGADPDAAAAFLAEAGLDSDAPPIRRAAVAAKLNKLSGDVPASDLRALLDRTLDRDQVETIADRLAELNDPVDLPRQFGFLTDWWMIGPFDHRDDQAFDATLPPERTPGAFGYAATYPTGFPGVGGTVGWREIDSDDDFGVVSVADSFENWKGSAVMLGRGFDASVAGPATFRIGTPNAFKLYLNGELLFAREEYHRGTKMDQYVIPAELKLGENVLMVKLLQNQQEQGWAQDYQIQFRVTDPTGAAVREAIATPTDAEPDAAE